MSDATAPGKPVPGRLFIVAAPSGAGKSTLVNALLAREPGIALSISHTTREPRPGDVDGVQYHFVDRATFERMVAHGDFLEHADVFGNGYGTSRGAVEPILATGRDVLLEIDWQGAEQVRRAMPECVSIFILPPSRAELERRLRARATDSEITIEKRLAASREEISHAEEFDCIIVNDRFEDAVAALQAVVRAARVGQALPKDRHAALVAQLLA
ncbi:MAG: guanylate kinase [Xanthomonadales bacterium]|nr:guanylate kinase [Xanthomonadales bacterium]ODU94355.1 MAG: guanylate kinase [Rhodanobacter sp. SCN 66-43]OJY86962.1 MAG: guanylate kinase [Xanthomonadales bacterium 66-474]